jgi:putative intracellular protease/amidase
LGPHKVLAALRLRSRYRTVVVGARVEPLDVDAPLKLVPTKTFDEVPHPFAVIVPGGGVSTLAAMANDAVRDYLRATADTAEVIGSIGTGALILAAAGLLKGRQATTRWAYRRLLENLGARYIQQRWVQDGKFMTAAGVSGGIDMALSLVGTLRGESSERWAHRAAVGGNVHRAGGAPHLLCAPTPPDRHGPCRPLREGRPGDRFRPALAHQSRAIVRCGNRTDDTRVLPGYHAHGTGTRVWRPSARNRRGRGWLSPFKEPIAQKSYGKECNAKNST